MADMSTSAELIVNEVLCYMQNNFKNSATNGLRTFISGFYTCDEVSNANGLSLRRDEESFHCAG